MGTLIGLQSENRTPVWLAILVLLGSLTLSPVFHPVFAQEHDIFDLPLPVLMEFRIARIITSVPIPSPLPPESCKSGTIGKPTDSCQLQQQACNPAQADCKPVQ